MTIVFKLSDNLKDKVIKYYKDMCKEKTPPYAVFQAVECDTVITLYESGKIMFQGISADIDANIWIDLERSINNRIIDISGKEKKEKKEDSKTFFNINTIGSDEVGTGDYFGPIVVSAAYVAREHFGLLNELGVKDSKKLTDDKIKKIAPELMKNIPYVTIILDNKSYNEHYSNDINMNKIKAILHNKALISLIKKDNYNYEKIVVDQFVYPKKYYEHIAKSPEKVKNITFSTKAEDKCFSVAVASIISRYVFLAKMKEMTEKIGLELPKGAGAGVDEIGVELVKKHGLNILNDIAKINFKNTEKIKEALNN